MSLSFLRESHASNAISDNVESPKQDRTSCVVSPTDTLVDKYPSPPPECTKKGPEAASAEDDDCGSRMSTMLSPSGPRFDLSMSDNIEGLVAVTTTEYERYERGVTYKKRYNEYTIPACTFTFPGPKLPAQWTSYIHPEGTRYFLKKTRMLSILTEAYINDPQEHARIEDYISQIITYVQRNAVLLPPEPVLVLEFRASGRCGYYFVNHTSQCLFWLDPFDFSHLLDSVRIPHTPSLVGLQMRSHYWYHNELFPHVYALSEQNVREIDDILVYSIGDVITAGSNSNVNHDLETLKTMHSMVKQYEIKDEAARTMSAGSAWLIFRFLNIFYGERFICLWGEKGARLQPTQSIHDRKMWANSWFLNVLTAIMIFGPSVHIDRLKVMTVDSIVGKPAWHKFRRKLGEEWRDAVLYATVVLTANVSFLTIQSVDEEGVAIGHRSHAQRASDFSIVTSMGTIIFGLLLLRQHREAMNTTFISNRSASRHGIEMLAIMYSMPYAFLMWSMISFFTAFCLMWYRSNDRVVITLISVTCILVLLLLLWGVTTAWEKYPYWHIWPLRYFCDEDGNVKYPTFKIQWRAQKSFRSDPEREGTSGKKRESSDASHFSKNMQKTERSNSIETSQSDLEKDEKEHAHVMDSS